MVAMIDDVFRVAAEGDLGTPGQAMVAVYHYKITILVDGLDSVVGPELKAQMDLMYDILKLQWHEDVSVFNYRIENVTQDLLLSDEDASQGGVLMDDPLPWQVSALVLGRTAETRRQGRKYIGGFTEANSGAGGIIGGSAIGALNAYADLYIAEFVGVSGNEYTPGVLNVPVPPASPLTPEFAIFTSRRTVGAFRTQRSRTLKLGAS